MTWMLSGVLGIAVVVLGLSGLGRWRWAVKTRVLLDRLQAGCSRAAAGHFDPNELDGLPAPVARYLRAVIPVGTPIIRSVDVVQRGSLNLSDTDERWRPFTSRQHVVTRRPGFVWDARVSMAPGFAVHVHDAYVAGEGILEPALLGLFPLARLRDRGEVAWLTPAGRRPYWRGTITALSYQR